MSAGRRPAGEAVARLVPAGTQLPDRRRERATRSSGLDRLTDLAARLLHAPSAQVALLTHEQLVAAGSGLPEGVVGSTGPLEDSLCTVTVEHGAPLVVPDAAADERVRHLPPVRAGDVGAYLGIPLETDDGHLVGALCVFGPEPRAWTAGDVAVLTEVARAASSELELSAVSADLERDRMRWELAVSAGGVGSFDWDLRTGALVWDDRLLEIFGYTREEFGRTIGAFNARLHPDDVARVRQALDEAIARCSTYEAEYRVVLPGDVTRWVQARGTAVAGPDGTAVRVLGVAYDTTANRESDARLTRVLETMSAAFYSLDAHWRFTYVNAEAERLLGRHREELLGGDIWELFPAAVGSPFETQYRDVVRTGTPRSFEAYYPEPLDGWFELRAWPTPDGLSVYFLDITERRSAQRAAESALASADRATRRLEMLARVSQDLGATLDIDEALASVGRHVVPALADWCIITLVEEHGLRDVGTWHVDPAMRATLERYASIRLQTLDLTSSYVAHTITTGEPSVIPAPAAESMAQYLGSPEAQALIRELAPETAAVLPLRARGRTSALITLCRGAGRPRLGGTDLLAALELAERAGLAVDNARLYSEQHTIAEGLQRSLLAAPVQPEHMQVAVRYQPAAEAAEVGGDWYDAFRQPDGSTVLVIGDVMGHDITAAADMSQVRSLLRGIAYATGGTPAGILSTLDAAMQGLGVGTTATAVVARVEQPAAGDGGPHVLRWSNAGHPAPVVLRPDGTTSLLDARTNDLLLGMSSAWPRADQELELEPGTTVLLYTDGLVERRDRSVRDGMALLLEAVADLADHDLDGLVDGVLERLSRGRHEDDVALVAVRLDRVTTGDPPPSR
ncbi:SpoIIE family protein phosphatase [Cellulomonas cellasea]|uniref:PAS domain S-box-containing protein n=1 Tax=Cellulomonas cellasea TaxID=43670 RepID=A0A7W4YCT6_9CELL|nr:SpoIIE family protein phosphatase [Cellulomonas cellasea]MBB2924474.1 PAS domain S-box-containing protein [Cellulomonas cellasea]